ncbi:MAG: hypothetical protein Q7R65_03795, partial [bacterium]|nr:hypothetical protein [bacterium]
MENEKIPEEKPEEGVKQLRTYQGDVQEIMKEGGGSLAKIAVAESNKRARGGFVMEKKEAVTHTKLIVIISVILIVAGIGAVPALYFFKSSEKTPLTSASNR